MVISLMPVRARIAEDAFRVEGDDLGPELEDLVVRVALTV